VSALPARKDDMTTLDTGTEDLRANSVTAWTSK
jgi:hypothetical protein